MNTTLKRAFTLVMAIILSIICLAVPILAEGNEFRFVIDDVGLLDDDEMVKIEQKLKEVGEKYGISVGIAFLETRDDDYRDIAEFNADLYESLYGRETDGVLLTVIMDTRDWDINTSGICRDAYGWFELDDFEDDVIPCLSDGRYAYAAYAYAENVDKTLDAHTNKTFPVGKIIGVSLVVGFVIALVSVLAMKGQLKSVKANNNANSYVKKDSLAITSSGDIFLYRNVVKTPRQTQSSSGGGYRRSSGGGSYGGRSGKF